MRAGRFGFQLALVFLMLGLPAPMRADSKPLLVYYMPWYVSKPQGENWGWHWTMDHFNPETINAAGERQIASWYYPLIGPYDSSDPAVLEYHVLLMKLAGIDGVIVDWYGIDDYLDYGINNRATAALFDYTRRAGLKFSLCYEDQTLGHMVDGHQIEATNAVAHAREMMLHLQTNYFADPSFLRWNSRPVLLNFGPQYFKANADWQAIFSVLEPGNRPAFFTEDDRLPVAMGAFDWPPMWISRTPGTAGVLSLAGLRSYLAEFDQKAAAWPAFVSSAFPRFHDIYQQTGVRDYWGYLGDHNGNTLRETLSLAMTNNSAIVQIVTWNDFGEGTVVEPTREYGYRDLGIIQELRRKHLDRSFRYRTNDLALPLRLFKLRRAAAPNSTLAGTLDRIFTNIISGDLTSAEAQLSKAESPPPAR
jgi:hypothetical protein